MVGSEGFEPSKLSQLIYSQSHLATLVTAPIVSNTPVPLVIGLSDQRPHYSRNLQRCQALFIGFFRHPKSGVRREVRRHFWDVGGEIISSVLSLGGESHL